MGRYEEALKELENSIPSYIKKVGRYQYENDSFTLIDHYDSEVFLSCEICGKEKIKEIFVIENTKGRQFNVGNVCITNITSPRIKKWFIDYKKRQHNIKKNSDTINNLHFILKSCKNNEIPVFISTQGIHKLQTMFRRLYEGKDCLPKQASLYNFYVRRIQNYMRTRAHTKDTEETL